MINKLLLKKDFVAPLPPLSRYTINNPNAFGTSQDDFFGHSAAITESYTIAGAYGEDDAGGTISGKAYIYNNTTGALLWTLDNPNAYSTSANDYFGWSVSISESYAIVGAYDEDDVGGGTSGKAYIFNPATGALLWTLDNPNPFGTSVDDRFGQSVSISDSYAIVSAPREDDAGGTFSGKAYIYNPATGVLLWTLDNPNAFGTSQFDYFGWSVGISDSYAIVCAFNEGDAGGAGSGKAYIYNPATGALLWTLANPNLFGTSASDQFGISASISNTHAIVGAYQEDDAGGNDSGKAYIFNADTGALLHTLDNPNAYSTSELDKFGGAVAISNSYAIVGAVNEDDTSGQSSGRAYIFDLITGALLWTLDNPNPFGTSDFDNFGHSVSIVDSRAIVVAHTEDDAGGTNSGKAYLYKFNNPTPATISSTLENPIPAANDKFGTSASMSYSYTIVGASTKNSFSGAAYIYNNNNGALLHTLVNPNPFGTVTFDQFGFSVSISDSHAIVGAYREDEAGGNDSGKAYIYNTVTGALLWTLDNPNPFGTVAGDYFGYSVGISDSYAIVGAYQEDDVVDNRSGKAYIYDPSTGALLWTLDNPNAYNTSQDDFFGNSVAITDSYAIVSATGEDDANGLGSSGKAYIFNPANGTLLWTLDNPNAFDTSTSDQFGNSVGISDSYAIVGAYQEDDAGGTSSGKAYIYNTVTGALLHTLDNPNSFGASAGDFFGWSVSISDSYAIVGARLADDVDGNTGGKAYIYDPATGALLMTIDNPNPFGTSVNDSFGGAVAVSNNQAIVGADGEDYSGGVSDGRAYMFNLFKEI
jgi:outer membrane protein assembly factor BamB